MAFTSHGSPGTTPICPGMVPNSGSARSARMERCFKLSELQEAVMNRSSSPNGRQMASCTSSPTVPAGGISTVYEMATSYRYTKWPQNLAWRSGNSACPAMLSLHQLPSFVAIWRAEAHTWLALTQRQVNWLLLNPFIQE